MATDQPESCDSAEGDGTIKKQEMAELISERSPNGRRLEVVEYLLGWRGKDEIAWTNWLEVLKLADGDIALEFNEDNDSGRKYWIYCKGGDLMMSVDKVLRDKPLFVVVFERAVQDPDSEMELVWSDSAPIDDGV